MFHQLQKFSFTHDCVVDAKSCKLMLIRTWWLKPQCIKYPIINITVIFKLQCTDGVRHSLDVVRETMRKVIHRVDSPRIPCSKMMCMTYAVHKRVSHLHVRCRHIYLSSKYVLTLFKFTILHTLKKF